MENRQDLMTRRGFLGRAIGAGLGAVVLDSGVTRDKVNMKNIINSVLGYKPLNIREYSGPYENYLGFEKINNLEGVLKNNQLLVVDKCNYLKNKCEVDGEADSEADEEVCEEQWIPIVEYNNFPGPEFDSKEQFEYFKIQSDDVTREDLRKFYTEKNGILTLTGDYLSSHKFGVNAGDNPLKLSVCFNPESMENGRGGLMFNLMDNSSENGNEMFTSIFNMSSHGGFVIESMVHIDESNYFLHMPIPFGGEDGTEEYEKGVRLTRDKSGMTSIELNWQNEWYPVVSTNALAGVPCNALINPIFYEDWKPELTSCVIKEFKCPEPEVILPEPDVFMGCYREL